METRGIVGFLQTLAFIVFLLIAWNSSLFLRGGRRTFYLFYGQILALDINWKNLNCWLKVTIMNYQI
jgi:hypothetical protein